MAKKVETVEGKLVVFGYGSDVVTRDELLEKGEKILDLGRKMNLLLEAGNIAFWHDVNFEEKIEDFLFPLAEKTRENYLNGIKHYLRYCSFIGVSPGNDDSVVAFCFRKWLEDKELSNSSIRLYITAVRLLLQYCIDTRENHQSVNNPFVQRRLLPKAGVFKKEKVDLTKGEVESILDWFRENSSEYLNLILKYQHLYGTRIGSFSGITKIKGDKAFYVSKGKECLTPIIIEKEDVKKFRECLPRLREQGPHNLTVMLNRELKKACVALGIEGVTSHRLRAYFCNALLGKGMDSGEVSLRMNHRNRHSIDSYVANFEKNESVFRGLDAYGKDNKGDKR